MLEKIAELEKKAVLEIEAAQDMEAVKELRVRYLGKKGAMTALLCVKPWPCFPRMDLWKLYPRVVPMLSLIHI